MSTLCYHLHTIYLFSCNNIRDIICLGALFGALNASIASSFHMGPALSLRQIIARLPAMILWSWSNLFLFNLHNQRHPSAIAEDAINKPWRPIPSGRLSSRQATYLMYCMYPVILVVSYIAGGLVPCLLEIVCCLCYNEWGGASDPFVKNFLNGIGMAFFLAGPLEVATGHSVLSADMRAATWLSIIAAAITTTVHAQDFRDLEGDKASGRRTVPLVIGDSNARYLVAVGVLGWTSACCWFWGLGFAKWQACCPAWMAGAIMVSSFLWNRTLAGDVWSWKLFPLWVLGLFVLPMGQYIGK